MSVRDLSQLANEFSTNALVAERLFESGTIETQAFATISLYADWEEYCRRLLFASAATRPFAADGRRIARAPGIRSIRDAESALKAWKRRRPSQQLVLHLGAPTAMVDTCKHLRLTNESVITPAIVSQGSPADELRRVRNFLAHQNPSTAQQVTVGPTGGSMEISSLLKWLSTPQTGGRTLFGNWVEALSAVARACTF